MNQLIPFYSLNQLVFELLYSRVEQDAGVSTEPSGAGSLEPVSSGLDIIKETVLTGAF